jgi:hypothetical protein
MLIDRALQVLIVLALTLWAICLWNRENLPGPESLAPQLFDAPVQTEVRKAPFLRTAGGTEYTIKPLYEYDLYGLVVSEHDSSAFWDWIHEAANDHLNVVDLCVVWGDDARRGSYRDVSFSSGEFVCYFRPKDAKAGADFDIYQISNNHLLTENPRLARALRGVHIGDEVHFHGFLSEYEHDQGFHFHRGTSVTRFDTGDGACETVYVTEAQVLRSHDRAWRLGCWISAACVAGLVVAWFARPPKVYR